LFLIYIYIFFLSMREEQNTKLDYLTKLFGKKKKKHRKQKAHSKKHKLTTK